MKKTVSLDWFIEELQRRSPNNFSEEALTVIFNVLIDEEELFGEKEFDYVKIRSEWSEYEDIKDFWDQGFHPEEFPDFESINRNGNMAILIKSKWNPNTLKTIPSNGFVAQVF